MRFSKIKAITLLNFKSLITNKVVLFGVIVWPILLILLSAYIFVPPGAGELKTLTIGVINMDVPSPGTGLTPDHILSIMTNVNVNGKKLFNVKIYGDTSSLLRDLRAGKLDAGFIFPEGFSRNVTLGSALLLIYVSGKSPYELQVNRGIIEGFLYTLSRAISIEKSNIMVNMTKIILESMNIGNITIPGLNTTLTSFLIGFTYGIASPLDVYFIEEKPWTLFDRPSLLGYIVIGAVGTMLMYSGLSIGASALLLEKESGRLERLIAMGLTPGELLVGKYLSVLMITSISTIITLITGLIHGAKLLWNPLNFRDLLVPFNILTALTMAMFTGFILSLLAKTSKDALVLGIVISTVTTLTTGILLPRYMLPSALRAISEASPYTLPIDLVRAIMVENLDLEEIFLHQMLVVVITLNIILLGVFAYNRTLRRYVEV